MGASPSGREIMFARSFLCDSTSLEDQEVSRVSTIYIEEAKQSDSHYYRSYSFAQIPLDLLVSLLF